MTTPQITTPGAPPDPLAPQPTFRATFYAYLQQLVTAFGQANTVATWMGTTADTVATNATTASNAATTALGATDYQGEYNAGTLYAVGESVSKIGSTSLFVKKTTAPAGTAPVNGTDWLEVPSAILTTGGVFTGGISENHTTVTSTSNALTIDCDLGNDFTHVLTENTTVSFTDPPASGSSFGFSLEIVQDASASGYTVTWPASVRWPFAAAPTLTSDANAIDVFVFKTDDGGTTWYGFVAGQAMGVPA